MVLTPMAAHCDPRNTSIIQIFTHARQHIITDAVILTAPFISSGESNLNPRIVVRVGREYHNIHPGCLSLHIGTTTRYTRSGTNVVRPCTGLMIFPRAVLNREWSLPASASARGAMDFMRLMEKREKNAVEAMTMSSTAG